MVEQLASRSCLTCGVSIVHRRRDAKFCESSNCRAKSPTRPACTQHGCGTKQIARGYCRKHYEAWKLHGDPQVNLRGTWRKLVCKEGHDLHDPSNRCSGGGCRRCKQWRATQAWRVMGWTERQFVERVAAQGYCCTICRQPFDLGYDRRTRRSPAFDHCHKTGGGRGIICRLCNTGLGAFGDDPDRLEAAASYLRRSVQEVERCLTTS